MPTAADFEVTASILRHALDGSLIDELQAERIGVAFAREYEQANPRFDAVRFLVACGLEIPAAKRVLQASS